MRGKVPVSLSLEGAEHGIGRRRSPLQDDARSASKVRGDNLAFLLRARQIAGRVDNCRKRCRARLAGSAVGARKRLQARGVDNFGVVDKASLAGGILRESQR